MAEDATRQARLTAAPQTRYNRIAPMYDAMARSRRSRRKHLSQRHQHRFLDVVRDAAQPAH